ncbi:MAG: ImmA/IrrE family metallo-endopeptidase [Oscillospiraceae bacterium]|nr:ImmA/IrrE family metallo-endopeptidase [Oscillospiraceae bacterium]
MKVCDVFEAAEIGDLPINPAKAAGALGIKTVSYGTMTEIYDIDADYLYRRSPFGFSFKSENRFVIAVNENSCGERKRRFTIAHELGHCVLGHTGRLSENRAPTSFEEHSADRFAADFLAPLPVLILCGVESAGEIKKICGISGQAAEIRYKELVQMRRSNFLAFNENQKIAEMFSDFIERYRSAMNR